MGITVSIRTASVLSSARFVSAHGLIQPDIAVAVLVLTIVVVVAMIIAGGGGGDRRRGQGRIDVSVVVHH